MAAPDNGLAHTLRNTTKPKKKRTPSISSLSTAPPPTNWCYFCLSYTTPFCSQNLLFYRLFHPLQTFKMRTAMRPKHQSLILRCYPAVPKTAEAKANPSELSYLLYYASTRRSKLQKVGKFLEKRANSDVWRGRTGNVYVTLEICKSLIEKCSRDLNLFATSILTILQIILKSKDISLIEQSLSCFESFCAHHDGANLSSDPEFVRLFEETITLYAGCATSPDARQALKWRSVGLQAIKSIASSEALSSAADGRRQLNIIIPVILHNFYSDSEDHLLILQQRANEIESEEVDGGSRHRLSLQTVQTNGTTAAAAAAAGTAEAADRIEEEDIGVLALQSLKSIFEDSNTAQIRYATATVLDFVISKENILEGWATALLEMIAKWAPVQYRHLILITCQETLARLPINEDALTKQLTIAHLISWLLASSVNLIGLSVMDVLLSFINHIIRLLQVDSPSAISVKHLNAHENPSEHDSAVQDNNFDQTAAPPSEAIQKAPSPSEVRKDLLEKLKSCVGNLGTHIYYSDQITDMISEILVRLKPSQSASPAASLDSNLIGIAVGSPSDRPNIDGFFSFSTARSMGLKCVKEIIIVANIRGAAQSSVGRNAVPLSVWDGTTWLLKEDDEKVRINYMDALATYLNLEVRRLVVGGNPISPKRAASSLDWGSTSFLKLLHVAIFEATLQYAPNYVDMLAIHLILTLLVKNLGIHALVSGLPMIYKLQLDIDAAQGQESQVAISSIIAGYLITVGETFGLEDVQEGVRMEIAHRKEYGQWFSGISHPPENIPPLPAPQAENIDYYSPDPILPFENKIPVVNDLCEALATETTSAVVAKIKDTLLAEWSKESVLAELESHSNRQTSVTESRMAGNSTVKTYLNVAGANAAATGITTGTHNHHHSRPNSKNGVVPNLEKFRVRAQTTGGSTPHSSSSKSSMVRVDELKKVLNGRSPPARSHHIFDDSSGSECQSYISSDGEDLGTGRGRTTLGTIIDAMGESTVNDSSRRRRTSVGSRRGTVRSESHPFHDDISGEQIPPVPKLPTQTHIPGGSSEGETSPNPDNGNIFISNASANPPEGQQISPSGSDDGAEMTSKLAFPNASRSSHHHFHQHDGASTTSIRKVDVHGLLFGIDETMRKRPVSRGISSGIFRPPY